PLKPEVSRESPRRPCHWHRSVRRDRWSSVLRINRGTAGPSNNASCCCPCTASSVSRRRLDLGNGLLGKLGSVTIDTAGAKRNRHAPTRRPDRAPPIDPVKLAPAVPSFMCQRSLRNWH